MLDCCPKCHGVWLDRGEYDKIIDYLRNEAGNASIKDVENEIAEDVKRLVKGGGSESRVAEVGDIAAAVTALLNFTIFEHPKLTNAILNTEAAARSIGMD
jgi:hypothetical protein